MISDEQREAIEWANGLDSWETFLLGDAEIRWKRVKVLLSLARSAESAEARTVERCAEEVEVMSLTEGTDDCFNQDKPGCAAILADRLRSLAPEPAVCTYERKADGKYDSSCPVDLGDEVDILTHDVQVGCRRFCPGCGRPIRVKEE